MCYVDDVVIATPTLKDHIDRLDEVFGCMKRAGLKCKPSKCEILRDSIKYLGRMVDRHGVRSDPEAVEAVLTWKAPRTDTQLLSFLGFANYYREFIKGYADKVYPMQKLMRNKGKKLEWNDEAQVAFENIKQELCEAPVLGMPTEKGMYVQTPRLRAFETNERRVENFVGTMDPYFVGRNAAVLQYTRFAYTDQATRRRISNAATPKAGRFDEEWKGLGLAPMRMRGRTELPEASLILTSVKQEMTVGGILQTRTFLAPFGCEEIKVVHGEEEDRSASTLLIPRFPEEADNDEKGPSSSNKDKSEGGDGQGGSRQTEEPMQQDQAGGEDDRASTGGTSSLDFNIFSELENNADTLETTEPADEGISTLSLRQPLWK